MCRRNVFAAVIVLGGWATSIQAQTTAPAQSQTVTASDTRLLLPLATRHSDVEVVTGDGDLLRGRLMDASSSSVVIESSSIRSQIPLGNVRSIWRPAQTHVWRDVLVGAGVGVGLGGLAMAGQGDCQDPNSVCAQNGAVTASDVAILAGIGAGVGATIAWWRPSPRHLAYLADTGLTDEPIPPGLDPRAYTWGLVASRLGEPVEVQEAGRSGARKGTLVGLTPTAMSLLIDGEPYIFRHSDVRRVWKPRRSYWWVPLLTAWGTFEFGVLPAALVCGDKPAEDACYDQVIGIAAVAAGTIATVRTLAHNESALIYEASGPMAAPTSATPRRAISVAPMVGRGRTGVACAVRF